MPKLVVGTFLTVDGVMQAPGGPDEDREGGFEHGGWSVNYWDDVMGQLIVESTLQGDVLLLGRKTYEIFAAHWPNVGGDDPIAAKLTACQSTSPHGPSKKSRGTTRLSSRETSLRRSPRLRIRPGARSRCTAVAT